MLFSRAVALSILATLGAQGMIIPNIGDVVNTFKGSDLEELKDSVANSVNKIANSVSESVENLSSNFKEFENKVANSKLVAPLLNNHREKIAHKYIVVFKTDVSSDAVDFHREWVHAKHAEAVAAEPSKASEFAQALEHVSTDGGVSDVFSIGSAVNGYTGYFMESVIDWIRRDPNVAFVEQDSIVHASEFDVQKSAPWGLARISHRDPLSLGNFNQYLYDNEGGEGVTAYVIDTGVSITHTQFEGRAKWGKTIPDGDTDTDGNGHGTHCAGTIASKDFGVAKKATVVGVKVLKSNGSGTMSDVVKGVEWAVKAHADEVKAKKKGFKGSTANMSLGGGQSAALDLAVNAAVKSGVHFAVAAGNENQDAANTSPARAELVITVGASTISDSRAYFSNYGKAVDIFAPGLNILSTYIGSDTATATLSGTSMASPHICGLVTYYLSLQPGVGSEFFTADKGISTTQMKKNLIKFGTKDKLTGIPEDGTPNVLAFNGAGKNLTEFWYEPMSGADAVTAAKSSGRFDGIAMEKIDTFMNKIKGEEEHMGDEIKKFVANLYNGAM